MTAVAPAGCLAGPVPVSVPPALPMSLLTPILMGFCLKEVVVPSTHQGELLQLQAVPIVHIHGGGGAGRCWGHSRVSVGPAGGVSGVPGVHEVLQVGLVRGSVP